VRNILCLAGDGFEWVMRPREAQRREKGIAWIAQPSSGAQTKHGV